MGRTPKVDWEAAFYEFATRPPNERILSRYAKEIGVNERTIRHIAKRDDWHRRIESIDRAARVEREKKAPRRLNDRLEDNLRIVEAGRTRFAQRLRDPSYQITAQEFFALAKLELLIEGRDTQKIGIGSISDDFKDAIRRLPVYVQERIILSHWTGQPVEDVLELEQGYIDVEGDDEGPE